MSIPEKHHHVPQFYLSNWAQSDGRVAVYSRRNGRVVVSWRAPKHTAFEPRLYSISALPEGDRQWVEREVMSKAVDDPAAKVMKRMIDGELSKLNSDERSAWARFIMAQWIRSPEVIANLRSEGRASLLRALQANPEEYLALKGDAHERTLVEWVDAYAPGLDEIVAMGRVLPNLVANTEVGNTIINMVWQVLHFVNSGVDLITSDRPATRFKGLDDRNCMILVPLSPSVLFVASHYRREFRRFSTTRAMKAMNNTTVDSAHTRIYGTGAQHLPLVEKRLRRSTQNPA